MNSEFEKVVEQISTVVLGKEQQVRLALTCLLAEGHLLIEDLPGIGKTTLAKVLAKCLGLEFQRVQFTSDLLPGDILGISIFDQKTGSFSFHRGPIFTQVLLADEINRATPKTQSALLEAMEEGQVTFEGKTRILDPPFFVIATQNPMEYAGTFPLPESQLDRFLMRVELGYPDRDAEKRILQGEGSQQALDDVEPYMTPERVTEIQQEIRKVHTSDTFIEYIRQILHFTRTSGHFHVGLSPRAGLAMAYASRAWAFLQGRHYVIPEDLQQVLPWIVGHRLRSGEDRTEISRDELMKIFLTVAVPL